MCQRTSWYSNAWPHTPHKPYTAESVMKFISRLFHLYCSSASQLYSVSRKSSGLIISTPKKQPISTSFEFAGFKKQLEFVPSSLESAAHTPSCQWVISESTLQCEEPFSDLVPPTAIVWEGENVKFPFLWTSQPFDLYFLHMSGSAFWKMQKYSIGNRRMKY